MFLHFYNEIRKKRWYVSDGQHSACHSVGPSSLDSSRAEDGRVEGRRAREGGRPSEGLPTAGRAWGEKEARQCPISVRVWV